MKLQPLFAARLMATMADMQSPLMQVTFPLLQGDMLIVGYLLAV